MNKKELVEYLKKNMPFFSGSEEKQEIKKALYIYIELGKIKAFDERYFFGNSETKKKMVKKARTGFKNMDELASKKKITCITLTKLYCDILKEFNIDAYESQPTMEDDHIYPIIRFKKGKNCIADLQSDLTNIQTRSRLSGFKYYEDEKENQEFLTKFLIELGYITKEEDYKDEKINNLKQKLEGLNVQELLEKILSDDDINSDNMDMGIVEINTFYRGVLKKLIKEDLDNKVHIFNCYRIKEGEKSYTPCIFSEYKNNVRCYLFSKKYNRFILVTLEQMESLENQGLVLGAREKENGSKKLKKYIRNFRKNNKNAPSL